MEKKRNLLPPEQEEKEGLLWPAMEKKRNLLPPEVEPPLKQHKREAEQDEKEAFEQSSTSPFGQTNSLFGASAFGSSSTSFGGLLWPAMEKKRNLLPPEVEPPLKQQKWEAEQEDDHGAWCSAVFPPDFDDSSSLLERLLDSLAKDAAFGATRPFPFRMKRLEVGEPHTPFSLLSIPAITEQEDGGTSGHTAKSYNYERYESCFALAGADYCVIAADFTRNISELSGKCVMASFGFQADVKALQEALSAENLRYECEHNKPMSCPEMHRLLFGFEKRHPNLDFIVLGGLDSEGKGRVFQICGPGTAVTFDSEVGHPGSRLPPILKYKLPAKDVLAGLSETKAVDLVKDLFKSATNTGDKLEIFVLNASGLRRDHVDLREEKMKKK